MSKLPLSKTALLFVVSILFFVSSQVNYAQSMADTTSIAPLKKTMLRLSILNGRILKQNRPFLKGQNAEGNYFKSISAYSLEFGWQMMGGKEWHQTCNYPRVGFGLQYLTFVNRNELGEPYSFYAFYDGNYFRSKKWEITNRLALGLSYGVKTYNPDDEIPNDIFCTKLNSFIEVGFGIAARINDFLFIEPGFRLIHFSNGNIREPQKGLNNVLLSLGLRSNLGKRHMEIIKTQLEPFKHSREVLAFVALAPRQIEFSYYNPQTPHETLGMNYIMSNLHLGYMFALSRRVKIGAGVDLIYDGTNGQQEAALNGFPEKSAVDFRDKMGLSIFIGSETAIDKLSLVTAFGYRVAEKRFPSSSSAFEQRLGFKYHFYENVFAGINVRSYKFSAAKAIEYHVGMRKFLN